MYFVFFQLTLVISIVISIDFHVICV